MNLGEQKYSNVNSFYVKLAIAMKIGVLIIVSVMFFMNNWFNDMNQVQKLWIQTEIIALLCEIALYIFTLA